MIEQNSCTYADGSAYKSSIGCTALLDALRIILDSNNGAFEDIELYAEQSIKALNHGKIPDLKTTKNKGLLRDVIIASFMKKITIKHKFYQKEEGDFDDYLILEQLDVEKD